MKKIIRAMLCLLMPVFLSGCVKAEVTYNVSSNGSVTSDMTFLAAESMWTMNGMGLDEALEKLKAALLENHPGVKAEIIKEDNGDVPYAGIKYTGLKEEELKAVKEGNQLVFEKDLKEFMDEITDTSDTGSYSFTPAQLKSFGCRIVMIIKMPAKAESNYGTVEGKKVTVDLLTLPADAEKIRVTCSAERFPAWLGFTLSLAGAAAVWLYGKRH